MGFSSWRSIVSGKDIMNYYGDVDNGREHDGIAIILPDNTIVQGHFDGYSNLEEDSKKRDSKNAYDLTGDKGVVMCIHALYECQKQGIDYKARFPCKHINRDSTPADMEAEKEIDILQSSWIKANWGVNGRDGVKAMLRSEVEEHLKSGKTFDDYPYSESAEGQGFWKSSYTT